MGRQPSRSSITIYQRGRGYYANVQGRFGGGYSGAHAGDTPEQAAVFALRESGRYISTNPLGGDIIAPAEVREAISNIKGA